MFSRHVMNPVRVEYLPIPQIWPFLLICVRARRCFLEYTPPFGIEGIGRLEDLGDLKREATDPLRDRSRPSPSTGNLHGPVFPRSFGSPRVPQVPCRRKNLWPLRP